MPVEEMAKYAFQNVNRIVIELDSAELLWTRTTARSYVMETFELKAELP